MGANWGETGRRGRAVALAGAGLAEVALVALIAGGLRVDLRERAASVLTAIDLSPVPSPTPTPQSSPAPRPAGAAAEPAPREVHAVPPKIPLPAPPVPVATSAGVAEAGTGSGVGDGGAGTGAGIGGAGAGTGGGASRPVKIAGTIAENARDFPVESRAERLGRSVVVSFLVGTDGRPSDCRIVQPSGSPEADAITCELIVARFRYRPALDQAGQPVAVRLGWRQSWRAP